MHSLKTNLTTKQTTKIVDKLAEEKRREILMKLSWKHCTLHGEYVTRKVLMPDQTIPANTNLYVYVQDYQIFKNILESLKSYSVKNYNDKIFVIEVKIQGEVVFSIVFSTFEIPRENRGITMSPYDIFNFPDCNVGLDTTGEIRFPLASFTNCCHQFYLIEMRKSLLVILPFLNNQCKNISVTTDKSVLFYTDMLLLTKKEKQDFLTSVKFDVEIPSFPEKKPCCLICKDSYTLLVKVKIDRKKYFKAIYNKKLTGDEVSKFLSSDVREYFHGYKISVKDATGSDRMASMTGYLRAGKKGKVKFLILPGNYTNNFHCGFASFANLSNHLEEL